MSALVRLVAGAEARRRTGSLLLLGLLVAVVTAGVAAGIVGARRTATAVDRFRDWAGAADGSFQTDDPSHAAEFQRILAAQPEVTALARRSIVNTFLDGERLPDIAIFSDPSDRFGRTMERPHVISGRLPRADAPNEIALNDQAATLLRRGVGARLHARTWSAADLEALFSGSAFPGFHGPRLDLRVVSVVRTLDGLPGDVERTSPYALASPRFLAAHPKLGAWPPAFFVRTRGGIPGFERFAESLPSRPGARAAGFRRGGASSQGTQYATTARRTADREAVALLVFAAAAALAGALVVGQAIARHLAGAGDTSTRLRELGATRTRGAFALSVPVVASAALGVLLGAGIAVLVSPLLPVGLARRAEVEPGFWVDPGLLALSALVVLTVVAAGTFLGARRLRTRTPGTGFERPSRLGALLGHARPPTVAGLQLAMDRRVPGDRAVPVRTAVLGLALGVAATVGGVTVVTSYHDLTRDPAHWGRTWTSEPDVFDEGADAAALTRRLARDPRVDAVAIRSVSGAMVAGRGMTAITIRPVGGRMTMQTLTGRLPRRTDEVALGTGSLADLHRRVGDTVSLGLPDDDGEVAGSRRVTIVGTVLIPPSEDHALNRGVVLTPAGYADATPAGDSTDAIDLTYAPGTDVEAAQRVLSKRYGLEFNAFTEPQVPGAVRQAGGLGGVAVALAVFFGVLGLLSILHALLVTVRRRRVHFAVLRVLGFTPGQVERTVAVQATALGAVAVVIGVPLGLVLGRAAWRAATHGIGAISDWSVPWWPMLVVVPATLAVTLLAAWWPAWRAAHRGVADSLRSE